MEQLPRTSRYQAAVHGDDEMAARVLATRDDTDDDQPDESRPALFDWSPEVERLTLIADLIAALRADFAAVNSKNNKRPKTSPLPRPQTAFERVKAKSVRTQHKWITKQVLPGKG